MDTRPAPFIWCSDCRSPMRAYYYALDSRPVCPRCKPTYAARIERGAGPAAMGRALLYGAGAALAGVALLGAVGMVIGFGRSFCAIGIGYMVGRAVNAATGSYFDVRYRVIAALLTYFAVGLGSLAPIVLRASMAADARRPVAVATATPTDEATGAGDDDGASVAAAESPRVEHAAPELPRDAAAAERLATGGLVGRIGAAIVLLLTLPLLAGLAYGIYGAAIGLLAIGYGVYKAWDITGEAVAYTLSGPHRVGSGPIPQTF